MAVKDKATLTSDLNSTYPDNVSGLITPASVRGQQVDMIDSLVDILEGGIDFAAVAFGSQFADQQPLGLDSAYQVLFGAGGTITGDMTINADGSMTCNTTGCYLFRMNLNYGRAGSVGASDMFVRILVDGVQLGGSGQNRFNSSDTRLSKSTSFNLDLTATENVTVEIIRDSLDSDDGGLYTASVVAGWTDVPSASIVIYKGTFV
jgi:hypothetical protein